MLTSGTASARRERVPRRPARREEGLGSVDPEARPAARGRRTPLTQRTSDSAQRLVRVERDALDGDAIGRTIVLE